MKQYAIISVSGNAPEKASILGVFPKKKDAEMYLKATYDICREEFVPEDALNENPEKDYCELNLDEDFCKIDYEGNEDPMYYKIDTICLAGEMPLAQIPKSFEEKVS